MVWYVIGAALWIVSLLLVITVFRMENARNSHRAMELEKRYTDLRNSLQFRGGSPSQMEDAPLPHRGMIDN